MLHPRRTPDPLPRQPGPVEPIAGPSRTPITMSNMTEAMIPLLKDNISQIVADALKVHDGCRQQPVNCC